MSTAPMGSGAMSTAPMGSGAIDFVLAFADDEHLMGQQHTEWIGVAPFLEEDLAFSSIGQDELGHAVMLYELVLAAGQIEPSDEAIDHLAYRRSAHDYRSCALVEYPATDWAEALVRHWIYDEVELYRWESLTASSIEPLRAVAASALREEAYHRRHADALVESLLHDQSARTRLHGALDVVLPLVPSLLTPTAGEAEAMQTGLVNRSLADMTTATVAAIAARFEVEVRLPEVALADRTRAERSAYFAPLMARMCEVLDYDPEATW